MFKHLCVSALLIISCVINNSFAQEPISGYTNAGNFIKYKDIRVSIEEVKIDNVELVDVVGDAGTSENKHLIINLRISNHNKDKIVHFEGWGSNVRDFLNDKKGWLKDNLDNGYKRINFGILDKPVGQVHESESIYPEKVIEDMLIFQEPVVNAEYVLLHLPVKALGFDEDEAIKFQIPRSYWVPEEVPKKVENKPKLTYFEKESRAWTSADKKFTVQAIFIKIEDNNIVLEKEDGTQIKVPKEKLLPGDWIKATSLAEKQK